MSESAGPMQPPGGSTKRGAPSDQTQKGPRWYRSASQMASWIFRHPSKQRLRYVSTYFSLRRSRAFDPDFYRSRYPDVDGSQNPLMHYIEHGVGEGRNPNSRFSTLAYLYEHREVMQAGINPLLHFIRGGADFQTFAPLPTGIDRGFAGWLSEQPSLGPRRLRRTEVRAHRRHVSSAAPAGADVLVVSGGDPKLLEIPGVNGLHFPQREDGAHPGNEPSGSVAAIAHLEALRAEGAQYLSVPTGPTGWLAHYPEFRRYLDRHYARVAGDGVMFSLEQSQSVTPPLLAQLDEIVEQHNLFYGSAPALLDWESGLDLGTHLSESTVIEAVTEGDGLPYLTNTVDLVVVGPDLSPAQVHEARRVAGAGVVTTSANNGDISLAVEWLRARNESSRPVSIVIPTYNGAEHLRVCLRAVSSTVPSYLEAEVIVVDDASTDATRDVLEAAIEEDDRIRWLRQPDNRGFVDSCNHGAAEAKGEILVFLNNDTIPVQGWLQPLIRTLGDHEDAGAAGSMLVYPDGTLQEAGAAIFSDGTGANLGKADPKPDRPMYRFVREVDYCSGAVLATPAAVFEQLGGFDTLYRPCYYEDTDYCFRVREAGLRVYYQPESIVVHVEGGTAGTDPSAGPKRYQAVNQEKFVARWADALELQPRPPRRVDLMGGRPLFRRRPPVRVPRTR